MVIQGIQAQDAEDLRWLRIGWLKALIRRSSVYSIVTAGLVLLYAMLGILDIFESDITAFERWLSIGIAVGGLAIVGIIVLGGRELPSWVGLAIVILHAGISIYYLGFSNERQNAIAALQEMPIMAMYFSWFYGARVARIGELVILLLVGTATLMGPWTADHLLGVPNLLGAALFTWLCLEAGLYVRHRLRLESHTDELTGVLNRRGFLLKAQLELRRAQRHGRPLTFVVLDLDKFKSVNDLSGHAAGDDVLRSVTAQWMSLSRATDLVGRLGGDEFALLLPETDDAAAEALMVRLRSLASHPWSWGAAQARDGDEVADALARADAAMYGRKQS